MKEKLVKKLHEIYFIIKSNDLYNDEHLGLCGGGVGISLFLFYYEKYFQGDNIANDLLERVLDKVTTQLFSYNYSAGLSGIGWTINYLDKYNFINVDNENLLEDIEPYIFEQIDFYIKQGKYDFLHGYLGLGFYFLTQSKSNYRDEAMRKIISALILTAENDNHSFKWSSYSNKSEEKSFNISLSHGSSSIIAFLSKALNYKIQNEEIKTIINNAIAYILKQELNHNEYISYFPSLSIESEKGNLTNSRLAWCYGDLGIAMALLNAGEILQNKIWKDKAIEILIHAAIKRRNLKENTVVDAGLCHGTAGIAHIFYRAWWNTKIPEFKEAAHYWFNETLKMAVFPDGLAGYKAYYPEEYGGLINMYGFLEGISGIGLAMISYITETEPTWDESLLLS